MSIGDVLTLLRQEFPDVTISKIRFLESQGLVNPERTPSGYRKFYEHDVERLRWVLRQQREHFLPLKVIKDRLDDEPGGPEESEPDRRVESGATPPPPTVRRPTPGHPTARRTDRPSTRPISRCSSDNDCPRSGSVGRRSPGSSRLSTRRRRSAGSDRRRPWVDDRRPPRVEPRRQPRRLGLSAGKPHPGREWARRLRRRRAWSDARRAPVTPRSARRRVGPDRRRVRRRSPRGRRGERSPHPRRRSRPANLSR